MSLRLLKTVHVKNIFNYKMLWYFHFYQNFYQNVIVWMKSQSPKIISWYSRLHVHYFYLYKIHLVNSQWDFIFANRSVGDVNDIINFKMRIFCSVRVKWHWQRDKMVNGGFYQNKGDQLYYPFISVDRFLMCQGQSSYRSFL